MGKHERVSSIITTLELADIQEMTERNMFSGVMDVPVLIKTSSTQVNCILTHEMSLIGIASFFPFLADGIWGGGVTDIRLNRGSGYLSPSC